MTTTLQTLWAAVSPYLPVIVWLLLGSGLLAGFAANSRLQAFARETIAAVYRVALNAAAELGADGLAWLRSPAGVTFRQTIAARAYDALPATVGGLPVGLVKAVISRDRWIALVEQAFAEMTALAVDLEANLPPEARPDVPTLFVE